MQENKKVSKQNVLGVGLVALARFRENSRERRSWCSTISCKSYIFGFECFGRPLDCVKSSQVVDGQSCILCVEGRGEA
jgi:hypothetical protein